MNDKVRPDNSEFEGDHFEGYNNVSDRKVGVQEYVVVDMFRRNNGTWFGRISLRSRLRKSSMGSVIGRSEQDFDSNTSEHDFLQAIALMSAALCEDMNSKGDMFPLNEVVREAVSYAAFKWREIRGET
jgi:hypothetical protein